MTDDISNLLKSHRLRGNFDRSMTTPIADATGAETVSPGDSDRGELIYDFTSSESDQADKTRTE